MKGKKAEFRHKVLMTVDQETEVISAFDLTPGSVDDSMNISFLVYLLVDTLSSHLLRNKRATTTARRK